MKRKKILLIAIIVLAIASGAISASNYFNQGVDFLNGKIKLKIPKVWDIPFKLGLDLRGGTHLVYEADLTNVSSQDHASVSQGLRDVIERRINFFGISEPIVQVQRAENHYRLIVELAGVEDPKEAIKMIGQTPFLEFKEPRPEEEAKPILDKMKELEGKSPEEIEKIENWQFALEDPYFKPTQLTGKYLKRAELSFEPTTQKPMVSLEFNEEGAKIFEELTEKNIGMPLAIYIDGVLLSNPTVQEKISGGRAQISGSFTIEEAKSLARNLNAGALPVPIKLISEQSVGPTLGLVSLQKSLKAGLFGLLLVILFMIIFYRLPGILASIALLIYIALILALFKLISATLTLAGIGGFILSIGMAVDANVLIFSRLREELKGGKGFGLALEEGFKRSWPAIRDGNLTTLIATLILFSFGTSFIKGFALILTIGVLASMFSAIIITRTLMRIFVGTRFENWKWLWA